MRGAVIFVLAAAYCAAQSTKVNLGSQSTNADFSALTHTRPMTVGTVLPATCQTGEQFFNSAAQAGQNLYACTATNTWTLEGAASVASLQFVADTGSINAYAGCPTTSIGALSNGLLVLFQAASTNTGNATFNLCGLGAKVIQTAYGAAMQAGMIQGSSAGSPGAVLLQYTSAAAGGNGAWQNLTPGQVQLAPQTALNRFQYARADGDGLTQWNRPFDPGDGRRISSLLCNGVSGDLSNTAMIGALWIWGSQSGGATMPSASAPSGTQYPYCTITTGAVAGDNVYYTANDTKLWITGRNLMFDTVAALSSAANVRVWIGFNGSGAGAIAQSSTPDSAGFIGFRYDTGAADPAWQCVISKSASPTIVSSSVTPDTNQHRFQVIADDAANTVRFFVDGSEVCSGTSVAQYPPATGLTFSEAVSTLTAGSRSLNMAYIYVEGDK